MNEFFCKRMWNKAGVVTVLFLSLIQMAQIMDAQEIKLPTCEFAGGKSFMQAVIIRKTKCSLREKRNACLGKTTRT